VSESKSCAICGGTFYRQPYRSANQWANQRFCSRRCANVDRAQRHNPQHNALVRSVHGERVKAGWLSGLRAERRQEKAERRAREAAVRKAEKRRARELRAMLKDLDRVEKRLLKPCWCPACKRAKDREATRQWRLENPKAQRAQSRRWKALNRGALGWSTAKQDQARFDFYGGLCAYCGRDLAHGFHWDHVIPLIRGGTNWPANLRPACPKCNASKRDKPLSEWQTGGRA
jgi:hypothetical protein